MATLRDLKATRVILVLKARKVTLAQQVKTVRVKLLIVEQANQIIPKVKMVTSIMIKEQVSFTIKIMASGNLLILRVKRAIRAIQVKQAVMASMEKMVNLS